MERAEKTHGKDVSCIKSEPTRRNPTTTTVVNIAMSKESKEQNKDITLCVDIMHINNIGFVTLASHPLHHQGCKDVNDNTKQSFHNVSDKMSQTHNKGGH